MKALKFSKTMMSRLITKPNRVLKFPNNIMRSVPQTMKTQRRFLNLHEFQAHQLYKKYGINHPEGKVAETPEEAKKIAEEFGEGRGFAVKSQVLAGGRGKGTFKSGNVDFGGVVLTKNPQEVYDHAKQMLGNTLVTKQASDGLKVNYLYVQKMVPVKNEYYFAILNDRENGALRIMASQAGGKNVEEEAQDLMVSKSVGLDLISEEDAIQFAKDLNFINPQAVAKEIVKLHQLYVENDLTLLEVNPMIELDDKENNISCADAKMALDINSEFRHKELVEWIKEKHEIDELEKRAVEKDMSYVGLSGDIGCIVNGAGLAMATMDILKEYGGEPANFLDVGGSASVDQIKEALLILRSNSKVTSVLVNIFGGIMRCDVVAEGLLKAVTEVDFDLPLAVRLQGTNSEKGWELIKNANLKNVMPASDLDEAAQVAVKVSKQ